MEPLAVGASVIVVGDREHHGKYGGFIQEYFSLDDGTVMASVLLPDGSFIQVLPQNLILNPGPPPGPPPPPPPHVWPGLPRPGSQPSSAQDMATLKPYLDGTYKTLNRFSGGEKYGRNERKTRRRQRQRQRRQRQSKRNRKNKYSRRR
jgi:hypothetical protein